MELSIWAKSFFSIYRCLDKLANSLDKYIKIKAFSSYYHNMSSLTFEGTEQIADELMVLSNKKISLINVKVMTDKILTTLPKDYARFVILKYMENNTFEEVADKLFISTRTAIRWNEKIIELSGKILYSFGYDENRIKSLIGEEKWIKDIVYKIHEEKISTNYQKVISPFYVMRLADREYRSLVY